MGKHKTKHREDVGIKKEIGIMETQENETGRTTINEKKKKEKKKKKKEIDVDDTNHCINDFNLSIKSNIEKHMVNEIQEISPLCLSDVSDQFSVKKAKKKGEKKHKNSHSGAETAHINEAVSDLDFSKDNHKRKRSELHSTNRESKHQTDLSNMNMTSNEEDNDANGPRKRKKHKQNKSRENVDIKKSVNCEGAVIKIKSVKKKRRNEILETTNDNEDAIKVKSNKKKKKRRSRKDRECSEIHIGSEIKDIRPKHNYKEVENIKNENQIKDDYKMENDPMKGQWETCAFEDDSRQNKFLRLLGGFKNGTDISSFQQKCSYPNITNNIINFERPKLTGSLAMNKHEQETYKKTMEMEYQSAMSMHLNRGIGLGFQNPQPHKKFSIDTQQSKSVKFEDSD